MSLSSLISQCLGERDPLALARSHAGRWQPWLEPISPHAPVGDDPAYDDDFQCMREEVNKLSGADADRVMELAEKLFTHSCKDLRIATYYLWARLHKDGEAGLADGLTLLAALVERFAAQVLPTRANSRKMALEWLAGSKVLDSLSLYPEVARSEAERTVAALAWLEQGLEAWPQEQRPSLGTLYGALTIRLNRSGGADALVPQHSAARDSSPAPTEPPRALINSGPELLAQGRLLAAYLHKQPDGWLAAHRLMKSLRWDTLQRLPPEGENGHTRLGAPRNEYRTQLKRLYLQQDWTAVLARAEQFYCEGVNHFWLDLQWYLYQALSKLPAPRDGWADIVKRDLGMFLERLPGLELCCWNDGTPFADDTTRDWISQHVCSRQTGQWLPAPAAVSSSADADIFALESEALAQADSDGVDMALAWLAAQPELHTGRQRWLLRLVMARVAEQYSRQELAMHLLTELDTTAQQHALAVWEPELIFEVKARLLKVLRLKAQRSDTDKPELARRSEALMASLVAIDPVRAAVLCG